MMTWEVEMSLHTFINSHNMDVTTTVLYLSSYIYNSMEQSPLLQKLTFSQLVTFSSFYHALDFMVVFTTAPQRFPILNQLTPSH